MLQPMGQGKLKAARRTISSAASAPQGLRPLAGPTQQQQNKAVGQPAQPRPQMQTGATQQGAPQQVAPLAQGQARAATAPPPSAPPVQSQTPIRRISNQAIPVQSTQPQGPGSVSMSNPNQVADWARGNSQVNLPGADSVPVGGFDQWGIEGPNSGKSEADTWADMQGEAQNANEDTGQKVEDLVRQYLDAAEGTPDTTEQEALIEQRIKEQLGMDLMDQRAAAGASGFEASGALMGIEGDIRRQAATDAVEQVLGARSDAQERAFEQAMAAAGMDLDRERFASDAAYREAQIEALNNWLEAQGAAPIEDGGGLFGEEGSPIGDATGGGSFWGSSDPSPQGGGYDPNDERGSNPIDSGGVATTAEVLRAQSGGGRIETDENGVTWVVYVDEGGNVVRKRAPKGGVF